MIDKLRPFLVSAPLTIDCADILDTNNIYIFNYKDSFVDKDNKEELFISYLESFGGMFDVLIDENVTYIEKEKLITEYFYSGSFMNIFTFVETMRHILFRYKNINYIGNRSILSDIECDRYIKNNKDLVDTLINFYDSLFIIMLLYSSKPSNDIKTIKNKFSNDRITAEELSPNICNLLLNKDFYDYYDKHIGNDLKYYSFMFENNLYKGRSFINILTNSNNTLLPILLDMNDKRFMEFIEQQKKRG